MTSLLTRRSLLRGLFAMPAVVAASSLMPVRGIIVPILSDGIALQSIVHPETRFVITGFDMLGNLVHEEIEINKPTRGSFRFIDKILIVTSNGLVSL